MRWRSFVVMVTLAATPVHDGPAGPTYAERIVARHDCWTGDETAPVAVPGHVVATRPRDRTLPVYGGTWLTGLALEQVAFDHPELGWTPAIDHGIVVYGFCR